MSNKIFISNFNNDSIDKVIELSKVEGNKVIYVSSSGGQTRAGNVMVDIINETPEEWTIKVTEQASSTALALLLYSKCKVEFIDAITDHFATFVFHGSSIGYKKADKEFEEAMAESNTMAYTSIKKVFTDKQRKKYENYHKWTQRFNFLKKFMDDDIYLSLDQMKELLGDRLVIREK